MQRSLPDTPAEWAAEIEAAYADAAESKAFGPLVGETIADTDLYQLAPHVCIKFRGLDPQDEKLRDRVVRGALANYVSNTGPDAEVDLGLESRPRMAFALCYVTAHLVLEMIDEEEAHAILSHYEEAYAEPERGE